VFVLLHWCIYGVLISCGKDNTVQELKNLQTYELKKTQKTNNEENFLIADDASCNMFHKGGGQLHRVHQGHQHDS
jgi:hypothetical protein